MIPQVLPDISKGAQANLGMAKEESLRQFCDALLR
jgi:hypothetical protein